MTAIKEHRIFLETTISIAAVTASILAIYYSLLTIDKTLAIVPAITASAAISASIISTMLSISYIKHMLKDVDDDVAGDVLTASMLIIAFAPALFAYGAMAPNVVDAITSITAGVAMLSLYYLLVVALIRTTNRGRDISATNRPR